MELEDFAGVDRDQVRLALYKKDYYKFVRDGWKAMFRNTPFKEGFHCKILADHLQAAVQYQLGNTGIVDQARHTAFSLPPRHTKSTFCSHFLLPYIWLINPEAEVICAAYKIDRAMKDSDISMMIMQSPWYQSLIQAMPEEDRWEFKSTSKQRVTNSRGGQRLNCGRTSGVAGENADYVIIDDCLHNLEAMSDVALMQLEFWWREVISMRFNNPSMGQFIIIGQRLSERDIVGLVTDPEGGDDPTDWNFVTLPSLYEKHHPVPFRSTIPQLENGEFRGPIWKDPRQSEGDPLFPAQYTLAELKKIRRRIGERAWATQHQGRPAPQDGSYFKKSWFRYISQEQVRMMGKPLTIIQSWDTAYTQKKLEDSDKGLRSSESVCTTWMVMYYKDKPKEKYVILADLFAGRISYPDLKLKAVELFEKWHPDSVIIENESSGKALLQDLESTEINLYPFNPQDFGGKKVRAAACSVFFENGAVLFPDWYPKLDAAGIPDPDSWNPAHVVRSMVSFPNAGADITDTVSQALLFLKGDDIKLNLEGNDEHEAMWESGASAAYAEVDNSGRNAYEKPDEPDPGEFPQQPKFIRYDPVGE